MDIQEGVKPTMGQNLSVPVPLPDGPHVLALLHVELRGARVRRSAGRAW
ncbi:MAG: hypothetical protein WKG07_20100 [Hymenobacter sp.]